jgi:O-antigen ligase
MALALLLTFTRSAAVGAALGVILVLIHRRPSLKALSWAAAVVAVLVGLTLLVTRFPVAGGVPIAQCVVGRAGQLATPDIGTPAFRLHVWLDSLTLVTERPLLGYGPDAFGLVYPRVQTGNWAPGNIIDKAHADLVQTAVTQGLVGVAAELAVLVAFLWAYWRSRRTAAGTALLAGWIAYQVATQFSFSWVLSAAPFWLFAAAAVVTWRDGIAGLRGESLRFSLPRWRGRVGVAAMLLAALVVLFAIALAGWSVARPLLADMRFFSALEDAARGQRPAAQLAIAAARQLSPEQSVYAVEAGNLDLSLDARGVPGAGADWRAAREDYTAAIGLGTFNPAAYRYLALADQVAGDRAGAVAAARKAVELDRFDPVNEAVLRLVSAP